MKAKIVVGVLFFLLIMFLHGWGTVEFIKEGGIP